MESEKFIKAALSDRDEVIDFINYVFSANARPHNFKTLLPKAYSDNADFSRTEHYLIKEKSKIKAAVADRIIDISYYGKTLKIGLIGSVSVHPYSRGKGYMKKLLPVTIEDAKAKGVDVLVLGGQRQRYGYFGFENAGICYKFILSETNIRHTLSGLDISDIVLSEMRDENRDEISLACTLYNSRPCHAQRTEEEFLNILKSWNGRCYAIHKSGEMIGYVCNTLEEVVLKDEADYQYVVKAVIQNCKEAVVPVSPFETERIKFLSAVCENYSIQHQEMISVLNWKSVIDCLLNAKSKLTVLRDGVCSVLIGKTCIKISVKDGKPGVCLTEPVADTIELSHNDAERIFFEVGGLVLPDERFYNWCPLPFYIDIPDTF